MKDSKMHRFIDQLLMEGKEKEAVPLIEEVWRKETQIENKMVEDFTRRLDALEKQKKAIRRNILLSR